MGFLSVGYTVIADVLIHYMQSQICLGWAAAMGHGFDVPVPLDLADTSSGGAQLLGGVGLRKGMREPNQLKAEGDNSPSDPLSAYHNALRVPTTRLSSRPHELDNFREVEPFCVSANDLINPLPPSLFHGSGWMAHHPAPGDMEDRHYWYATQPTSRLRVPVKLGAGEVRLFFLLLFVLAGGSWTHPLRSVVFWLVRSEFISCKDRRTRTSEVLSAGWTITSLEQRN